MKKALLTILSFTLLLPHYNFAMQKEHNKSPQETVKLSLGSGTTSNNKYGTDVQPSVTNPEQDNRFSSLNQSEIDTLRKALTSNENKIKTALDTIDVTSKCCYRTSLLCTVNLSVAVCICMLPVALYIFAKTLNGLTDDKGLSRNR